MRWFYLYDPTISSVYIDMTKRIVTRYTIRNFLIAFIVARIKKNDRAEGGARREARSIGGDLREFF